MAQFHTTCPRDCYDTCSIITTKDNGKIAVKGNPEHPVTAGVLCPKGVMLADQHSNRNRVRGGLIHGKAVPLDEAVSEAAMLVEKAIEDHGAESVLVYEYAGNRGLLATRIPMLMWNELDVLKTDHTICDRAGALALVRTVGTAAGMEVEGLPGKELIVYWGMNPRWTNLHGYMLAQKARSNGGEVAVVDVYRSPTAEGADHFFRIRPGTDAVFAIGVASHLLNSGLHDTDFAERHIAGYDEMREWILSWSPERAAEICGISPGEIRDFGEMLASRDFAVHIGYGMQRSLYGGLAVRAIATLVSLLGRPYSFIYDTPGIALGDLNPPWRGGIVSQVQLAREIRERGIKLIFVYNSNPLNSLPDVTSLRKALEMEGTVLITHELSMTETARASEVVIGAASVFESEDIFTSFFHSYINLNQKVFEPDNVVSNAELARILAREMGVKNRFLEMKDREVIEYVLRLNGLNYSDLEEKGFVYLPRPVFSQPGVRTADGWIHPITEEELSWPSPPREFRLMSVTHFSTITSQYADLHSLLPDEVLMCGEDARRLGVVEGDMVVLSRGSREVTKKVRIGDIQPGVVVAFKGLWGEANINRVTTDERQEEYGGGSAFHSTEIMIRKA